MRRRALVLCPGAILALLGSLNVTRCHLVDNRAHRDGGAIYVATEDKHPWESVFSNLVVDGSTLLGNTAEANGGEYEPLAGCLASAHEHDEAFKEVRLGVRLLL